jgi:tRNA(Ile)-lysidine synthase TilS/MesJ
MTLLTALAEMRRYYPQKYELVAITVDLGFGGFDTKILSDYCDAINVRHIIAETDIGDIVFNQRKEKNPCSLCSKMRKGRLNKEANELGCNKVALGHTRDDANQTLLMSLLYEGRLHCFNPVTYLDKSNIFSIRPLIYLAERDIIGYARNAGLPIAKNPCPVNNDTKREETKKLIAELGKTYAKVDEKIFGAINRSHLWTTTSKHESET